MRIQCLQCAFKTFLIPIETPVHLQRPLGGLQCAMLPLSLLLATILSECQGAQESLRHYQSPLLLHQKWCKLYTGCNPRILLDTGKEVITRCCSFSLTNSKPRQHSKYQHLSLSLSFGASIRTGQRPGPKFILCIEYSCYNS